MRCKNLRESQDLKEREAERALKEWAWIASIAWSSTYRSCSRAARRRWKSLLYHGADRAWELDGSLGLDPQEQLEVWWQGCCKPDKADPESTKLHAQAERGASRFEARKCHDWYWGEWEWRTGADLQAGRFWVLLRLRVRPESVAQAGYTRLHGSWASKTWWHIWLQGGHVGTWCPCIYHALC